MPRVICILIVLAELWTKGARLRRASAGLVLMTTLAAGGIQASDHIERIEPPFWWADMQHARLQIMLYGQSVSELVPEMSCQGVKLASVTRVASANYLFLDLELGPDLLPGNCEMRFQTPDGDIIVETYRFQQRRAGSAERAGFSPASVLYLITPDRFANGNPNNDSLPGMLEGLNRHLPIGRHGGDLQGIIDHLDYIANMGFTHVWLNPVLENQQPEYSYHGYSTTDYYKVDPRFGSNDLYHELSRRARELGLGLVMDLIPNHCGSGHWWMDDLPTLDWVNHGGYLQTSHVREPLHDPHAPDSERRAFVDGWFVRTMPDLNQKNALLSEYLIQNALWWVEFADLSGIRVDTWSYADRQFLSDWTRRVMTEYPNFNIVGEEWIESPGMIAYWQRGKQPPDGYASHLPSLMDFPLALALREALVNEETWNTGLVNIYRALAEDFHYADPDSLLVFADNHDMRRIFAQVNGDIDLFRLAVVFVLTTRGIPQIYYGTEILMGGRDDSGHGAIRADFPGGWPDDAVNGFTGAGLSPDAAKAQAFLKQLLLWRKDAPAVTHGELTHYAPHDGTYVYFRHHAKQRVMVAINKNAKDRQLSLDRFFEVLGDATEAVEVLTGRVYALESEIEIPARGFLVLEY